MTALRLAITSSATVAAIGLYLSFMSLSDLVSLTGRSSIESAAWAVAIDGLVVVSTFVVYIAQSHRGYAWSVFIAASLATLAANVTHAVLFPGELHPYLSAAIAAAPPLAHLVATHLTVLLLHDRVEVAAVVDIPADPAASPLPPLHAVAEPAFEPVMVEAPVEADVEPLDDRRMRALVALAEGAKQREAAELVGVSVRTIRRWQGAVA